MNSKHTKMNVGEILNNEYIKMLCSMNISSVIIPRGYFLSGQKSLRALKGNINKRDRGGDLEWADNSTSYQSISLYINLPPPKMRSTNTTCNLYLSLILSTLDRPWRDKNLNILKKLISLFIFK
jgi:hypothetical protein